MNIVGEKVILRALERKDNDVLLKMINDPETEDGICGCSFPVSPEGQEEWYSSLKNDPHLLRCIIADRKEPAKALGTVILSDIDYVNGTAQIHIKIVCGEQRRKGYGTDAVMALREYAFDVLRLHCIYAEIISYNEKSKGLFQKCGFRCDGVLRSRVYKKGTYWDVAVYSIQNEAQ